MGRFIPRGSGPHLRRGKAVWPMLLTCGLLVAASGTLFAQPGDNIQTYYIPTRSFRIPFNVAENDPRLEVLLHVSTDERTYRYVASARTNERRFFFPAPADGWYSFIVQTRDAAGVLTPPDLRGVAPSLRVCVDTQSPVIESLSVDALPDSLPKIRWKIAEANLKEILADYRALGGEWIPLFLPVQKEGEQPFKPSWPGELEVRMLALDKAGNRSEVRLQRLRAADNVSRMPPPQEPAGNSKTMYVKSKTFQLHYSLDLQTVGPSQVSSVDIWKLSRGQGWRKCSEKGTPQGPATVSVDAAGRWGFRLIPRSGVGLAERDPQPGDAPDIWVEVDDRPPHVQVSNVTVIPEADGGYLTVYWKADDAFLRPMPITIFLASPEGKDWFAVAKDLSNTGSWRQRIEDLKLGERYEFALKVEAVDEAGNVGSAQWRDTVKVDLKVPRIKHIEVKPGAALGGQETYGGSRAAPYGVRALESQPAGRQSPSPLNASGQDFHLPKPP
jgi:hypothetical protein